MIGLGKFIFICSVGLFTGCRSADLSIYPKDISARPIALYVANNHWHAGLVIATDRLSPTLKQHLQRFAGAKYIEIGWGDDGFYRAPKGTSGLATGAMFASQSSVLHVVAFDDEPAEHFAQYVTDLYRFHVAPTGEKRLLDFIEAAFVTDPSGNAIELQTGLYGTSHFYRARGHYGLCRTCNHWIADAIRSTGFPITPFWSSFADNVGWQLRVFGKNFESDMLLLQNGNPVAPSR